MSWNAGLPRMRTASLSTMNLPASTCSSVVLPAGPPQGSPSKLVHLKMFAYLGVHASSSPQHKAEVWGCTCSIGADEQAAAPPRQAEGHGANQRLMARVGICECVDHHGVIILVAGVCQGANSSS